MPEVVCNTTSILSLLKIGQFSLLETLYKRVIIPHAVWQEIEAGKDKSFYADLVIIDETLGRQYARHFQLPLTGTLGILLRAKKEGHVSAVKPLLEQLRQQGVWISDSVFHEALLLSGEV